MLITDSNRLNRYTSSHRVWQGIPGIARTKGGRIFISFYSGGTKETYGNYAAVIKSDDGVRFGDPIAVAEKAGKFRCFDPVLWIDPLDRLWFIWNVMPGEEVRGAICADPDAAVLEWSEDFYIGRGVMMNKPTVLSSGEWLFPIAIWKLDIYADYRRPTLTPEDVSGAYVYKTSDNGEHFIRLGYADVRNRSFDEHMVIEMESGVLRMLVRLNKGIGESYSYDRGKTWSRGQETNLKGPSSRFFIQKLRSGRVLLINHYQFKSRNNLTAMLSEDDGRTFPYTLLLDGRSNVSYPDAVECEDGSIYLVYDRERGCFKNSLEEAYADAREILLSRITEEDILAGEVCGEKSFLRRVVSRLDRLDPEDGDPFEGPELEDDAFARFLLESKAEDPIAAVFERYPLNCSYIGDLNAGRMDAMINRFREGGCSDVELLIEIIDFVRRAPQKKEQAPVIDKIKQYIETHVAEDFSVRFLAETMNISLYYLSHLFKAVTGITVIEYRNELRLTKAKLLLIRTDDSIGSIAQSLGFCSAAYFTEIFTASERIPPSEYRKRHRTKETEM